MAVRQNKRFIQDAEDLTIWGKEKSRSVGYENKPTEDIVIWGKEASPSVGYEYMLTEVIASGQEELAKMSRNTTTLKGTINAHAVIGKRKNVVLIGVTSCYCTDCQNGN
jgi:hypothetical protein